MSDSRYKCIVKECLFDSSHGTMILYFVSPRIRSSHCLFISLTPGLWMSPPTSLMEEPACGNLHQSLLSQSSRPPHCRGVEGRPQPLFSMLNPLQCSKWLKYSLEHPIDGNHQHQCHLMVGLSFSL